jgi:uncharacterized protein involved in type VI secretion and phage assembly
VTAPIAPALTVGGAPAPAALLSRLSGLTVDRGLGLVGRATLRFVEAGLELKTFESFPLGKEVSIKLPDGTVLLDGEVTGISLDQEGGSFGTSSELVVTVDDRANRLGRETRNKSYLSVKYSDVITTMAQQSGLQVSVVTTPEVHEYLLQAGSDLAYLNWMTTRSGLVWWIEGRKLVVARAGTSVGTVDLTMGEDLHRFSARASDLHPRKVTVTGWDDAQQQSLSQSANAKLTTEESPLVRKYPGRDSTGNDKGTAVADRSPRTAREATELSEALLAESFARAVTARGTCLVDGRITPSTTVRVGGSGPAAGSYLVTRVEHVYNASGFHTHFTAGPLRPADLVDLLAAPEESAGALMTGLVPALVTNNKDPDKIGRAKVKFTTMDGSVESGWARVVTLGGGKQRGMVFMPEINDEVLVGFEQGDTRRPVILGGLFSKVKELPTSDNVDADKSKVNYRRITSRLGSVIELADGEQDTTQHILLKVGTAEHLIRIGKDRLDIKVDKVPVSITNGPAKIEFAASGDVSIEGNNITIKGKSGVKIEAGTELGLKGTAATKVEGGMVDVKSQGVANVQAQAVLALKGATVAIN